MFLLFSIKLNKADMNLDTNISIKFKNQLQSYTLVRHYRDSIIVLQIFDKLFDWWPDIIFPSKLYISIF